MPGRVQSGGGWRAIRYSLKKAREAGGWLKLWKAMRSRNACKTCALGMGGQRGGMVNEAGHFPEVCKKSLQAMVADMQPGIPANFWEQNSLADLQRMTPYELEHGGRLVAPLLLEKPATHYRPISWHDAYERVIKRLRETDAADSFWYFSGRSSNEAGFALQLLARQFGTNNVNNCSYYCHQASGVGLSSTVGTGTATIVLDDLHRADLVFVIGGNPASNHPRLMSSLLKVRRRGGQVVVINPVVETGLMSFRIPSDWRSLLFGSKIATHYVQPDIGGDLALLWGLAKHIDELNANDEPFLHEHCDGVAAWKQRMREIPWDEIVAKSGVAREQIESIAEVYANSSNTVFSWTMGITHHAHGVQNVQAVANLALQRGMVGRPHAGLMPIRGHSNVQGIGSMGVTPKLKQAVSDRLTEHFQMPLPTEPGLDTLSCMEAAHHRDLKLGICLGGNLYGSNPDSTFAADALQRLETLVYLNTTLNTGHAHGVADETLILPVLARDEEPQATTQESMFNYVRYSDGGPARLDGPHSEVQVVARLGQGLFGDDSPIDWKAMRDTQQIRSTIAKIIPGFEALEQQQEKREFQIGGRTLHAPQFATASGKAQLHAHELPALRGGAGKWRLMTVRSEGQFNTVVYEEEDLYRNQARRDVILLHPDDLAQLEWDDGQRVRVVSDVGHLDGISVRSYESIKPGNALMYFPESNVLVPRTADAQSRTPAFKGIEVWLETAD